MANSNQQQEGGSVRIQLRTFPEKTFKRIQDAAVDAGAPADIGGVVRWALTQFSKTLQKPRRKAVNR